MTFQDIEQVSNITVIAAILSILSHIQTPGQETFDTLIALFESLEDAASTAKDNQIIRTEFVVGHRNFPLESLLGMTIKSFTSVAKSTNNLPKLCGFWDRIVNQVLVKHANNEMIARGVHAFMSVLQNK
jgi:SNF family Na+-dependent transporter